MTAHTLPSTFEVHSDNEYENIELALMEAIYISRWNASNTAIFAVLTPDEAMKMVKALFKKFAKYCSVEGDDTVEIGIVETDTMRFKTQIIHV